MDPDIHQMNSKKSRVQCYRPTWSWWNNPSKKILSVKYETHEKIYDEVNED